MTRDALFFTFGALLLACVPAHAECLQWGNNWDGIHVCIMDDLIGRSPIRATPGPGEPVASGAPAPKCDEGWTLVLDAGMHPMCARELRKPQ